MNKNIRRIITIWLILVFFIPITAYAAFYAIDTNDGLVDSDWSSVNVFNNDGNDYANDNFDIDQTWITSSSDKQFLYFRVSLVGSGQLPLDSYSSFEVRFDCNDDSNFDIVVFYSRYWDDAVECPSSGYWECNDATTSDWNGHSFAELIPGSPYNYEWMVDTVNGDGDATNVNWTGCLTNPDIWFLSTDNTGAIVDTTVSRAYNLTTAVTLQDFTANQQKGKTIHAAIYMALMGGVVLLVIKIFSKRFDEANEENR